MTQKRSIRYKTPVPDAEATSSGFIKIVEYTGRPFERAMWLDAIVQGALVEMESALKSESFDEDEWVESITRSSRSS